MGWFLIFHCKILTFSSLCLCRVASAAATSLARSTAAMRLRVSFTQLVSSLCRQQYIYVYWIMCLFPKTAE